MRTLLTPSLLIAIGLLVTLPDCGGQAQRPSSTAPSTEESASGDTAEAPAEKARPDCSDGGCILCGDTTCPKGFYCNESTDKPSCQWVPTCTDTVDCACVKKTVGETCTCSEHGGGVYLHCKP